MPSTSQEPGFDRLPLVDQRSEDRTRGIGEDHLDLRVLLLRRKLAAAGDRAARADAGDEGVDTCPSICSQISGPVVS
jgi:hypothetical protein